MSLSRFHLALGLAAVVGGVMCVLQDHIKRLLAFATIAQVGLFLVGLGTGTWDVAMNVEGAEVERRLGRSIMPRFHAAFSLGTVGGAGVGAAVTYAGVGVT